MAKRLAAGIALTALLAGSAYGVEKKVDPADEYYNAAVEAADQGRYQEALVYFVQVIEHGQNSRHFKTALEQVETGIFNRAKDDYIARQRGSNASANIWLEKAEKETDPQLKQGYKDKAAAELKEARQLQEELDELIKQQERMLARMRAFKGQ